MLAQVMKNNQVLTEGTIGLGIFQAYERDIYSICYYAAILSPFTFLFIFLTILEMLIPSLFANYF